MTTNKKSIWKEVSKLVVNFLLAIVLSPFVLIGIISGAAKTAFQAGLIHWSNFNDWLDSDENQ